MHLLRGNSTHARAPAQRAYVIVSHPPAFTPEQVPPPQVATAGRHRTETPGTRPRYAQGVPRLPRLRRARHRRTDRPTVAAARYGTLALLAGTIVVSGWFTATGASALAQVAQP